VRVEGLFREMVALGERLREAEKAIRRSSARIPLPSVDLLPGR
jgi:hypothetical protein